ncbi:cache domain-containing sensor histidine kinase [Hungatella hathewayi]|uniref:cache domain-containing sensor histidine kinase n=1 Tax=Hungatella hathewayi TaxID=154046 RepID=UPI00356AFC8E
MKRLFGGISKFSVKMFLLIVICVVIPFAGVCLYIRINMENFIQEKLSERIIQDISRGERNITEGLDELASLSDVFVFDKELLERISDGRRTEFDNVIYFNQLLDQLSIYRGRSGMQDIRVILFDNYGRVYSNWSLNYKNYEFLLSQDWVEESLNQWGHVTWSMFSPPYVEEDKNRGETYISLARSLMEAGTAGERLGTLILSMEQSSFSDMMMTYAYEGDVAYVCIDGGQVLLSNDRENQIDSGEIETLYSEVQGEKSGSLRWASGGNEYLMNFYTIPRPWVFDGQQMKVFHFTDYEEVLSEVRMVSERINAVILAMLALITGISYAAVRLLVKPIVVLTRKMGNYTIESEITGIDTDRKDEIGHLNQAFCRLDDNIKQLFIRLKEENKIKEQYRYESLRAQLNPHFLFNTLTTIRWMAMIRGAHNIVDSIDALAGVLKYSMSRDDRLVTLEEELDNIRNFVYIHNYRYEDYCSLDIDIPEEMLKLRMMKFILQPVVENALLHGYDKKKEQITISVYGYTEDDLLYLFVEDDGVGISEEVIEQFEMFRQTSGKGDRLTGIGLTNVDSCIRITFGEAYGLKLERGMVCGTSVTFTLPVITEKGEEDDEKGPDCG